MPLLASHTCTLGILFPDFKTIELVRQSKYGATWLVWSVFNGLIGQCLFEFPRYMNWLPNIVLGSNLMMDGQDVHVSCPSRMPGGGFMVYESTPKFINAMETVKIHFGKIQHSNI